MTSIPITTRDLTTYVAGGELAPEVRAEIKRQVAIVGSPVQRWVVDSDAKMRNPFAVNWGEIAAIPDDPPDTPSVDNQASIATALPPIEAVERPLVESPNSPRGVLGNLYDIFFVPWILLWREFKLQGTIARLAPAPYPDSDAKDLISAHLEWAHANRIYELACKQLIKSVAPRYCRNGRFAEAKLILTQLVVCLALREHDIAHPRDSNLFAALKALGDVHLAAGELDNAKARWAEAIEGDRAFRGDDSPDVADTIYKIGRELERYGDLHAARSNYVLAASLYENAAGGWHPQLFNSQNAIKRIDVALAGQPERVLPNVQTEPAAPNAKVLPVQGTDVVVDDTLDRRFELRSADYEQEVRADGASDQIAVPTKPDGTKDIDITHEPTGWFSLPVRYFVNLPAIASLELWAAHQVDSKKYLRAIEVQEVACVLGAGTAFHSSSVRTLGTLYWITGDLSKARVQLELAGAIARRYKSQFRLLQALDTLASFNIATGDIALAAQCQEEADRIRRDGAIANAHTVMTPPKLNARAIIYYYRGEFDKAINLLIQAEKWAEVSSRSNNGLKARARMTGVLAGNLAAMYERVGRIAEARSSRERSRRLLHSVLSADHPAITTERGVVCVEVRIDRRMELMPLMLSV